MRPHTARALLYVAAAALLTGCPVEFVPSQPCCGDPGAQDDFADVAQGAGATNNVQWRGANFPQVYGALLVANATGETRVVRVRELKQSIGLDCAAVLAAPQAAFRSAHFQPAKSWLVESGRAIPLLADTKRACTAMLLDGTGLPPRLVVFDNADRPNHKMPSVTSQLDNLGDRVLTIRAEEGLAAWAPNPALGPPPTEVDPVPPEGCALASGEHDLAWTAMPLGDSTLTELLSAPDGCASLALLPSGGDPHKGYICAPPGQLPFTEGESLFIAELSSGHNVGAMAGLELLSDTGHARSGRGQDLVYIGKFEAKVRQDTGCPAQHDACGTWARAVHLELTLPKGPATLSAGDAVTLPDGGRLSVLRASRRLLWDSDCAAHTGGPLHIETAWSKP